MHDEAKYSIFMPTIEDEPEQYKYVNWAVIYGLATRKHIYKHIENTYDKNRVSYYQAFKKSDYSSVNLLRFTTETSEMIIKVAGIMAFSENEKNFTNVFSLIEKGYKTSWNYLKRHQRLNLPDFYNALKVESRSDESNFQAIMGLFVASIKGYDFIVDLTEQPKGLTEEIEGSTIAMGLLFTFAQSNYENMLKESLHEYTQTKAEERKYLKEMKIQLGLKNYQTSLMSLIENYKNNAIEKMTDLNIRPLEHYQNLEKNKSDIFFSDDLKTITVINIWLECENISWYDFHENYTITAKRFEKITMFIYRLIENEIIDEHEERFYFSTLLIMDSFMEAYRKTQKLFYDNRVEEIEYYALERERALKEHWNAKEVEWKEKEKSYKEKLVLIEQEKNIWKREVENTRKRISKLEDGLEKAKWSEKELLTLKNYLATENEEDSEVIQISDFEEFFDDKKVFVIGGDPSWQQKLKSSFPGFVIWNADDVNRDFSSLKNADAICICWTYMSHPMYWKAKKYIQKYDLKLIYTGNHKNLEKTIVDIYKEFK